jgi:ABC-type lipoprotein export system ATPase subunit
MVTHNPGIAAYAGRIIFLKDGRIVDETLLSGDGRAGAASAQKPAEAAR